MNKIEIKARSIGKSHEQRLAQVVMVIHFEDHGQDFLRWGVDTHGNVMTCEPYQFWVWKNARVDLSSLEPGKQLCYYNTKTGKFATIKYPVEKIVEV